MFCKGCKTTEVSSNGFCPVCMTYIYGYYYADYPENVISEGRYNAPAIEKSADVVYGEIKPPLQYETRKPKLSELRKFKSATKSLKEDVKEKKKKQAIKKDSKRELRKIRKETLSKTQQITKNNNEKELKKLRKKAADKTQYFRFLQEYGSKTRAKEELEKWRSNGGK